MPGQIGNVVVAGHRTTYSRPFRDLDQLVVGDVLTFETPTGTFRYEFVTHDVVRPSDGHITDQPYGYIATLPLSIFLLALTAGPVLDDLRNGRFASGPMT